MKQPIFKLLNAEQTRRVWLIVPLAMILVSGCAGTAISPVSTIEVRVPKAGSEDIAGPVSYPPETTPENSTSVEARLRSEIRHWIGTPHRLGGTSRKGIDCSGFVEMLYRDILSYSIPRTTALQVKSGHPVSREQLHIGDLVFFKLPQNKRHVGIYLGGAEFAHASTTQGVIISDLDDLYWRDYFWMARRYLDE